MKAVIMAGGKGTRIAAMRADIPKPMIPVAGKPVLEHQICCLHRQGVADFILVVGYLGQTIRDYFGDGSRLWPKESAGDVRISYLTEEYPLGTAGALYDLESLLQEDFLLLNGDLIFDIDLERFLRCHARTVERGGLVTILTHPNHHPYDSAIVLAGEDGCVNGWLHREEKRGWYQNRVNAGLHLFSPKIFSALRERGLLRERMKLDLDRDILKPLAGTGMLYAYQSPEYVKDMGTPQRCREAEADLLAGRTAMRNLSRPQRAVFLDRDGTLNEYVGFLTEPGQLRLLPGTANALRLIHEAGYLTVVVTNQPVIARGEVTLEQLREIHNKLETLLGEEGAYLDAIYVCPHHPHRGFAGERPEYKINCGCRKPAPGLLLQAARELHIALEGSWMVGDRDTDIQAGKNAGCHTAGVYGCPAGEADAYFDTLEAFADFLCENGKTPKGT